MRTIKFLFLIASLFFSFSSYAKCTSFAFGVSSIEKNEFAFFDCKAKQVFQNSDLFLFNNKKHRKSKKGIFVGESIVKKSLNLKKINKTLKSIIKKSKKEDIKKIISTHSFHLTIDKKSYKIDLKSFNTLKVVLNYLNSRSKQRNGDSIKKKKFNLIKNRLNKGPINSLKLKLRGDYYFYNGLYWSL